jgi:C_GCAxxG_C_C family probable redox protein
MIKGLKGIFGKIGGHRPVPVLDADALAELAAGRAENFFKEHRLSCSEAALLVINHGFAGGLTTEQALCLGSGFGGGVGGTGCVCGSLAGAVMALGLLLGPGSRSGLAKKDFRKLVGAFHDSFREESGSVCCRDLIADYRNDSKGMMHFCRGITGRSTGAAVRIILRERSDLAAQANLDFLQGHDSGFAVILQKLLGNKIASPL